MGRDKSASGPQALSLEICAIQEAALERPQVPGGIQGL